MFEPFEWRTGLDVDFRVASTELLQLLISKKMFSEAREWAKSGVAGDSTVVFEEVTSNSLTFGYQPIWVRSDCRDLNRFKVSVRLLLRFEMIYAYLSVIRRCRRGRTSFPAEA